MNSQKEKIIVCSYDKQLIPEKHSDSAVCWDLRIAKDIVVEPGQLVLVGLWIKTFIPHGRQSKIYARSGLPIKMWLMLANSVWVIDADYRGEYRVQLYNFGQEIRKYPQYTRMFQLEFLPYYYITTDTHSAQYWLDYIPDIEFISDEKLYQNFEQEFSSERWEGGFNSTGSI